MILSPYNMSYSKLFSMSKMMMNKYNNLYRDYKSYLA